MFVDHVTEEEANRILKTLLTFINYKGNDETILAMKKLSLEHVATLSNSVFDNTIDALSKIINEVNG